MTIPITRVALYARVSSEEQATAGTIETQTTFLHRYCDLHGHRITGEYADDGVSGTIPLGERPAGRRLLHDARERAFDLVLCYRVDRVNRGRLIYLLQTVEALDALGIGLKSATEEFNTQTAMGRMVLAILGSFAEMDRESILERTRLGRARVARNGQYPGGRVPFGYRLKDRAFVVDEQEAATVKRIFALYGEGLGLWQLVAQLNADGVPAGRAREWTLSRVHRILRNRTYLGAYQFGAAQMSCPAILTPDDYAAVDRTRLQHQQLAGRNTSRRTYLLKGLIRCGQCGIAYHGCIKHGRPYYGCSGRAFQGPCRGKWLRADVVESAVWSDIIAYTRDPAPLIDRLLADLQHDLTDAVTIEAELLALEAPAGRIDHERQTVITLYRKGRISEAELDNQLDTLEREAAALAVERERLTGRLVDLKARELAILDTERLLRDLRERVETADEAEQQVIVRSLVERITVQADRRTVVTYRFGITV